jgi:hypothetical protein
MRPRFEHSMARIWLVLASLAACGRAPLPRAPDNSPAPPAAIEAALVDREWGLLRSPAQGMKLALPEARTWFVPAAAPAGAAWELRHEPTGTSLSVRRWRASRLPQVQRCEHELRQRVAGLLEVDETNLVGDRSVRAPLGFVTRITLVAAPATGQRLRGQAVAVGAGVGECVAAIAKTECDSEAELAERLRLLDVALSHLRLTSVEDRVPAPQALPNRPSH